MKTLRQFIVEAQERFPILIGEYNDDMEDAEFAFDDMKDDFFRIFDDSGAQAIIMYESESRKRMEILEYSETFKDAEDVWDYLVDKTWHGFRMYMEDEYTLGISHVISGPQQAPSEYFRFSKLTKDDIDEMIEEENGDVEIEKSFIKIDKLI